MLTLQGHDENTQVEAFDFKGCPEEDMSPCDVPASAKLGFPKIMWRDLYAEEGRRRRRV